MSLGFVVSFVMLSKDHIMDPLDVPRIAAAFGQSALPGFLVSLSLTLV